MPKEELSQLMTQLNGVFFCGGHCNMSTKDLDDPEGISMLAPYGETVKYIVDRAKEQTEMRNPFPMFGVCHGFQAMMVVSDLRNKILSALKTNHQYVSSLGKFKKSAEKSYFYGDLQQNLRDLVQKEEEKMVWYKHNFGITMSVYNESEILKKMFKVLSVHKDNIGTRFVSSYEGIDYPILGTQFHPEKHQYEWKIEANRSQEAIEFSSYLAKKFMAHCRKSKNVFPEEEFQRLSVHSYPTESDYGQFSQVYIFKALNSPM